MDTKEKVHLITEMDFRTVLTVGQSSQSTLHVSHPFFMQPAGLVAPTAPISTRLRYVLRIAEVRMGRYNLLFLTFIICVKKP